MSRPFLRVRELSGDEQAIIKRSSGARTQPAQWVTRTRIIWLSHEGRIVDEIAAEVSMSAGTVRKWIKRFNADGLEGLRDEPRSGRPPTYTVEQVGEVVAAALTDPRELDLPFAAWTLDRLEAYLNDEKGIPIKRSRIDDLLQAEGLRWHKQESWFSERVDPEFAEKRGRSSRSTRSRQPIA
jgi:transposase